jgi:TM2 domain-containing membrane protein YozV
MQPRLRAVLLSGLVFPGAGQMANGERGKGLVVGGLTVVLALGVSALVASVVLSVMPADFVTLDVGLIQQRVHESLMGSSGSITLLVVLLLLVWAYAVVDAWRGAKP